MVELSGSCLCGNVSYKGSGDVKMVMNCHCTDCQQATGSVHATMIFVVEDAVEFSGNVSKFDHPADSGNTLSKLFCGTCGSQVAGKNTGRAGVLGLRAGCLDQKDLINPGANIFCDSAIHSTAMNPKLKKFTGMPG